MNESNRGNLEGMILNLSNRMEGLEKQAMAQKQHTLLFAEALKELAHNLEQITKFLANSEERSSNLEEALESIPKQTNLDALQVALEKLAKNYNDDSATWHEQFNALGEEIIGIKTALQELEEPPTETGELMTSETTEVDQMLEQALSNKLTAIKQEVLMDQTKLSRKLLTITAAQSLCLVVALILTGAWITDAVSERLLKTRSDPNAPALDKP